ncbi:hypothetical protein FRB95_003843 [Tulasnella sp. JGI-2019a]|nr:hypothetical protein FRB95_003843 [Tulasnella sp. JGI-2019a]
MQTLSACSNLEYLDLNVVTSVTQITDVDVEHLVKHLPRLEHLGMYIESGPTPQLTLQSLVSALHHCPHLKFLGLWADATSAKLPIAPTPLHHNTPFTLNIGSRDSWRELCPIDSTPAAGALLARLPIIAIEPVCWGLSIPSWKPWREVERLIPSCVRPAIMAKTLRGYD